MRQKGVRFTHFGRNIERTPFIEGVELLYYEDLTFGSFLLHDHDAVEIMLIIDGDVEVSVEGERYLVPRGSLLIMPPQLVHQTIIPPGTKRYERMVMHIFPQYIGSILNQRSLSPDCFEFIWHVSIVEYSPETFWFLRTLFERSFYANRQSVEYQRLVIPSLVIELFAEVERILKDSQPPQIPATNNLVTAVVEYIDEHFAEPGLTVEQIRESVFVSQGYLSRIFKSYTGSSIYRFLMHKRLIRSKELLIQGETVLNACFASGFTDYTSFLKAFKSAFHMTPVQYRKNYLDSR